MSYKDRLRESIQLISPEGNIFTASWTGNDISVDKKLGIFDYANLDGSEVQDLGVKGVGYPLTFRFTGEDNDIEAKRFEDSIGERGTWEIVHPVDGTLFLQPVSITRKVNPVTSGNITEIESTWIEPIEDTTLRSTAQIGSEVEQQGEVTNSQVQSQYEENLSLDSASEQIANEQTINTAIIESDNEFGDIISQSDEISAEIASITTGIYDSLNQAAIDSLSLAGQTQQLIQLPGLATNNIQSRVTAYGNYITTMLTGAPETARPEDKNIAIATEMITSAALVGMANSIISGTLETRAEAIELIETIAGIFNDIVNGLDAVQENFETLSIDKQYFSNSQSYTELARLVGLVVYYLLRSSLDLKIEKRFTLEKDRNPIEITVTEYGSLGDEDSNLDFFIATNYLQGNDIRLLHSGREVVVYL